MVEVTYMVRATAFAQYDGTNGAELVAKFAGVVVSDNGTTLIYSPQDAPEAVLTATVGQWVSWQDVNGPWSPCGTFETLPTYPFVEIGS